MIAAASFFAAECGPKRVAYIMTRGTLCVALTIALFLVIHNSLNNSPVGERFWITCATIIYLTITDAVIMRGYIKCAHWLLIALYELLAAIVLLHSGIGSVIGILSASFAILSPGILMAPRAIPVVTILTLALVFLVHSIHATGIITPTPYASSSPYGLLDVATYATILGVFALASWVSATQSTRSLARALRAEETLQKQKELLAINLENESVRLRETQLLQIQQLYKFAAIGQSTVATLHELSNRLSILNLDIDDIKQHYKHSKIIAHAEDGIEHINQMVQRVRAQLSSRHKPEAFNVRPLVHQVVKDIQQKHRQLAITLIKKLPTGNKPLIIHGDAANLVHVLAILLNNAFDACRDTPNAAVTLAVIPSRRFLIITVTDTGPGVSQVAKALLFQPCRSSKATGLGVGLYIARHLVESQFHGTLQLDPSKTGASFTLTIPLPDSTA